MSEEIPNCYERAKVNLQVKRSSQRSRVFETRLTPQAIGLF